MHSDSEGLAEKEQELLERAKRKKVATTELFKRLLTLAQEELYDEEEVMFLQFVLAAVGGHLPMDIIQEFVEMDEEKQIEVMLRVAVLADGATSTVQWFNASRPVIDFMKSTKMRN